MINIKHQITTFVLLMTFSAKVFSCVGPSTIIKRYDERITSGVIEAQGSIENFLNSKYGISKWKYDEKNLNLKVPENIENPNVTSIQAYVNNPSLRRYIDKITIYYQDILDIRGSGEVQEIIKVATFNFRVPAIPYISTRLNLGNTQKVYFFAVFESSRKEEIVRVIKTPKMIRTGGRCTYVKYAKGDNDSFRNTSLERYDHRWSQSVIANNKIPTNSFKGFFFDRHKPINAIKTELVTDIHTNLSRSINGVKVNDLGAYWVGDFHYDRDSEMEINIKQGAYTRTRVLINDNIVFENNYSKRLIHTFKKGTHKVEVEHLSNYFSSKLSINIRPIQKRYSRRDIIKKLQSNNSYETWLISTYSAKNNNGNVDVKLKKSTKPIILLLQSYDVINWKIHNPHGNKIEAIVVGGAIGPGSSVEGEIQKENIYYTNFQICNNYNHKKIPEYCHLGKINNFIGSYKM